MLIRTWHLVAAGSGASNCAHSFFVGIIFLYLGKMLRQKLPLHRAHYFLVFKEKWEPEEMAKTMEINSKWTATHIYHTIFLKRPKPFFSFLALHYSCNLNWLFLKLIFTNTYLLVYFILYPRQNIHRGIKIRKQKNRYLQHMGLSLCSFMTSGSSRQDWNWNQKYSSGIFRWMLEFGCTKSFINGFTSPMLWTKFLP